MSRFIAARWPHIRTASVSIIRACVHAIRACLHAVRTTTRLTAALTRAALRFLFVPFKARRVLSASLVGIIVVAILLPNVVKRGSSRGPGSPGQPFGLPTAGAPCRAAGAGLPAPGPCGDLWRRPVAPNPTGQLAAPPSVSVGAIWRALNAAGSPLADNTVRRGGCTYAEYLWDVGRSTGIDPGVMMAFFNQESNYGTKGVAVRSHNPGNLRPMPDRRTVCDVDGCYAYAADWFQGIDDTYGVLSHYADGGIKTVEQAVPVWAPNVDHNDDDVFLDGVHQTMRALAADS